MCAWAEGEEGVGIGGYIVYDQPYAHLALEDTITPRYFTIPQGDIRVANGEENGQSGE